MKLTIITPNYNYSTFIGKTIESVVEQEFENIEHIIVDDGSKDDSVDIINSYQKRYPKIIKVICQTNLGQTAAINRGLKEASGEIIGWINSDDYYCKNSLIKVSHYFNTHPEIDLIFSDTNVIDLKGDFIYKKRFLKYNRLYGAFFGFANIMSSNTVFFRKHLLKELALIDESLKCNMDGDFFSKITYKAKVRRIPEVLANFRKQPHTKASEKHQDWKNIVYKERQFELNNSYRTLTISRIIPYKYSSIIKIWFRIIRVLSRLVKLHYFFEFLEKRNYRKTHR